MTDIPQMTTTSFSPNYGSLSFRCAGSTHELGGFESIWFRRLVGAVLSPDVHQADRGFLIRDWRSYFDFMVQYAGNHAFCVNTAEGFHSYRNKSRQLLCAISAGLLVPKTLISNDREDISSFLEQVYASGSECIVKSFAPSIWSTKDLSTRSFSVAVVTCNDIDGADVQSGVSMFQQRIEKAYEARVTLIGRTIIAAKLESNSDASSALDFRDATDWTRLGCERISVPSSVESALWRFQDLIGANFGTLDFVIDHSNNWYFLETNPSGNFFWMEEINPSLPLLDCFTNFLISCKADYVYCPKPSATVRLGDFDADIELNGSGLMGQEIEAHVPALHSFVTNE